MTRPPLATSHHESSPIETVVIGRNHTTLEVDA
jgi:hypothetical protein